MRGRGTILGVLILCGVGCGAGEEGARGDAVAETVAPADVPPTGGDQPRFRDEAGDRDGGGDTAPASGYFDQCTPGEAPDAACYAAARAPDSERVALALALAERWMAVHAPEDMAWSWEEGVLGLALVELHRVTGDGRLLDYLAAWIDHHIGVGYQIFWSDSCPPGVTAIGLYGATGEPRYRAVVDDILRYLYELAPRGEEGGIGHLGLVTPFGAALWLDSLFMFGMVLLRWSELEGEDRAVELEGEQLRIFTELLQDGSGWYTHAHNWGDAQEEGVFWARGNAWVTVAGHEYLRLRKLRGEEDDAVAGAIERQAAAVRATQDPATGLWWTVPDRPGETYLETSASALFAYGLARGYRYGLRGEEVLPAVEAAVAGLRSRIARDDEGRPFVVGTSVGTSAGTFSDYAAVPVEDDVPYGVGAVILLLVESSGLSAD